VGLECLPFDFQHSDLTIDGLLFFDGDSDDASLNPALNTAMLLERFVPMASNAEKKVAYQVRRMPPRHSYYPAFTLIIGLRQTAS